MDLIGKFHTVKLMKQSRTPHPNSSHYSFLGELSYLINLPHLSPPGIVPGPEGHPGSRFILSRHQGIHRTNARRCTSLRPRSEPDFLPIVHTYIAGAQADTVVGQRQKVQMKVHVVAQPTVNSFKSTINKCLTIISMAVEHTY
jgi:hypothetical protein